MDIDLLRRLCETGGVPGHEDRIREIVVATLSGHAGELTVDPIGNVIARRAGKGGPRMMLSAHMDEIGFLLVDDNEGGLYRFALVGGIDERTDGDCEKDTRQGHVEEQALAVHVVHEIAHALPADVAVEVHLGEDLQVGL